MYNILTEVLMFFHRERSWCFASQNQTIWGVPCWIAQKTIFEGVWHFIYISNIKWWIYNGQLNTWSWKNHKQSKPHETNHKRKGSKSTAFYWQLCSFNLVFTLETKVSTANQKKMHTLPSAWSKLLTGIRYWKSHLKNTAMLLSTN